MKYATIGYVLLAGAMSAAPSYGKADVGALIADLLIDGERKVQNGVVSHTAPGKLDSTDNFTADGEAGWNVFPNGENLEARFRVKHNDGEEVLYNIVDGGVKGDKPLDGVPEEGTKTVFEDGEEVSREKLDKFTLYRLYEWFISTFRVTKKSE